MTIIDLEMHVRERQQSILGELEHPRLLRSRFARRSLRAQLAAALFWLGEKLDPELTLYKGTGCEPHPLGLPYGATRRNYAISARAW